MISTYLYSFIQRHSSIAGQHDTLMNAYSALKSVKLLNKYFSVSISEFILSLRFTNLLNFSANISNNNADVSVNSSKLGSTIIWI
ncbi:MAG: hypothetical protein ACI97K_002795 [Glaciecola sp.]|jgi:hypothetical protein